MTALAVVLPALPAQVLDADATDARIVAMWLHGRSRHTIRAYRRSLDALDAFLGRKPLRLITLADLQGFADSLTGAASSRGQTLAAVKSLLSFAVKLGALVRNVGVLVKKRDARDGLADRIIDEPSVQRMLALTSGRDHALVRLGYASACRVSELVGGKTRTVRVSSATAVRAGIEKPVRSAVVRRLGPACSQTSTRVMCGRCGSLARCG